MAIPRAASARPITIEIQGAFSYTGSGVSSTASPARAKTARNPADTAAPTRNARPTDARATPAPSSSSSPRKKDR
jgi:hypothetical protein